MDVRLVCNGVVEDRGVDELQKLLEGEDGFVWVDIPAGDEQAVHVLSEVFRFHPMAVKDAVEQSRLPKMHAYHDHVFVVLHAPEIGKQGHVHYIESDQFIGVRYLVRFADLSIRPYTQTLPCARPGRCFSGSKPAAAGHSVAAFDFIETMTKDVWQLEQRLTGGNVGDPEKYLDDCSVPGMACSPYAPWAPKVARYTAA